MTTAAHAAVDIVYVAVATVEASRLPPVLVESTRTTTELTDWGSGDLDGDGEMEGVARFDGDVEGVAGFDGEMEGVARFDGEMDGVPDVVGEMDGVPDVDGVPSGVPDTVCDTVRVADPVPLTLTVPLTDGVGSPVGDTVGVPVGDEPTESVDDGESLKVAEFDGEVDRVGLGEREFVGVVDFEGVDD